MCDLGGKKIISITISVIKQNEKRYIKEKIPNN